MRTAIRPTLLSALLALPLLSARAASPVDAAPPVAMTDLGRSGGDRQVEVALTLAPRNRAALEALVSAQADRSSSFYHRFLTSADFNARFAPSVADHDRARAVLERAGFRIVRTYPNRSVIVARASARAAEALFSTEIHDVEQDGYGRRYANMRAGTVPAELADIVVGVTGLSNVHAFNKHIRYGSVPARDAAVTVPTARFVGPDGGYGPQIYVNAYNLPSGKKANGRGRAAAIIADADFLDSDLVKYTSYFHFRPLGHITRVKVGQGPIVNAPDLDELTLDIETMVAFAPAADFYIYEAHDFSSGTEVIDTYNSILTDNKVDVVSTSYGFCEAAFGSLGAMADALATQGAALGMTFVASTGDTGDLAFGCSKGGQVAVPAASPHFVAVGGTDLRSNVSTGAFQSEVAWIDDYKGSFVASGGGTSKMFALPAWQKNVRGVNPSGRNLPDIAFAADPNHGAAFYDFFNWQGPVGGTSFAAPFFGATILLHNQATGTRYGLANPVLYQSFAHHGYGATFRDMTVGVTGNSNGSVKVRKGYDEVTGIGSIDFAPPGPF